MSSTKNDSNLNETSLLDAKKLSYLKNPIKQTPIQNLIDLLKAYKGINECTNETIQHIDYVSLIRKQETIIFHCCFLSYRFFKKY